MKGVTHTVRHAIHVGSRPGRRHRPYCANEETEAGEVKGHARSSEVRWGWSGNLPKPISPRRPPHTLRLTVQEAALGGARFPALSSPPRQRLRLPGREANASLGVLHSQIT